MPTSLGSPSRSSSSRSSSSPRSSSSRSSSPGSHLVRRAPSRAWLLRRLLARAPDRPSAPARAPRAAPDRPAAPGPTVSVRAAHSAASAASDPFIHSDVHCASSLPASGGRSDHLRKLRETSSASRPSPMYFSPIPLGNCCRCARTSAPLTSRSRVMADDRVKDVAAVLASRGAGADDPLDLVDAVTAAGAVAVQALAGPGGGASAALRRPPQITAQSSVRSILVSSRMAGSSVQPVMVSGLLVRRNSSAAICLPSTFSVNFRLQRGAARQSPDADAVAGRRHFAVGVAAALEEELRPDVDRASIGVAAMVEIDRGKRIVGGEHVSYAVGMAGLHGGERGRRNRSTCCGSVELACRSGSRRLNGGFCHLPSGFCVQRQTHHCGRSISGASARGSFARSR